MKTNTLLRIAFVLLISTSMYAQTPEKMSYQAVIRDGNDALVINQATGMQISILLGSATGSSVYTETQSPPPTTNGLVSVEIGMGTTSDDFSAIDWTTGTYFIKTETDPSSGGGTNYTITGTSQLLSVPYALYAKTSGSSTPGPQGDAGADGVGIAQTISQSGNDITLSDGGGSVTVTDTNTHLTEAEVDAFANNNGYLTAEVDASVTNEIQTLSSVLTQGTDAGGDKITNLADPSAAQDAATKSYVDLLEATVSNLQSSLSVLESTLNSYIDTWYEDLDGDGFGNSLVSIEEIVPPVGYAAQGNDCEINDVNSYPGAPEIVDGIDNNCDGNVDEAICGDGIVQSPEECDGTPGCDITCTLIDADGDGFSVLVDCNDNDPNINPGAPELVDGIDNNCDGNVDEAVCGDGILQSPEECDGTPGCNNICTLNDLDGDGYSNSVDCDDNNPNINPGAPELVDGLDNNCDGNVDEATCGDGIVQPPEDCDGGPECYIDCTPDSDRDGVPDHSEIPGCENNPDCDGDGIPDNAEFSGCVNDPFC